MIGSRPVLKALERGLMIAGAVIGAWTLLVLVQHSYYAHLPVPGEPSIARHLPGEGAAEAAVNKARGSWLARLEAPAVRLKATVLEGSDDGTLRRAAGHIEYTALPGEPGNIGIAGHRDTTFYAVRNIGVGDLLTLTTAAGVFEYKVNRTWIVEPEDVHVLDPTPRPSLTLVTCYPFNFIGNAPKRFIVRGELVSERPRS
jgi:LPXTG-site transpeptidase (sortase) family protein